MLHSTYTSPCIVLLRHAITMSFRDVPTSGKAPLTIASLAKRPALPRVIVQESPSRDEEVLPGEFYNLQQRYNRTLILHSHGRPWKDDDAGVISPSQSFQSLLYRSKFPKYEARHCLSGTQLDIIDQLDSLQRLVKDLNTSLREPQSPESAWRTKILRRTADDTDQETWQNIQDDYRATMENGDRSALDTHLLLQREWVRIHKVLAATLKPGVEHVPRINDGDNARHVCDSKSAKKLPDANDDFFDRVTRQEDIEKVQDKMHLVHEIYNDLALLVDQQQGHIDKLNDNVLDAKITAEAAADEVACFTAKHVFVEDPCGGMAARPSITLDDDDANENYVYDSFASYFNCQFMDALCQPQDTQYEVEVVCVDDDDAVEIRHVDPPIQSSSPSEMDTWWNNLQTLQDGVVSFGMTLLEHGSPETYHLLESGEIKLW
jgi:hypothetical protein